MRILDEFEECREGSLGPCGARDCYMFSERPENRRQLKGCLTSRYGLEHGLLEHVRGAMRRSDGAGRTKIRGALFERTHVRMWTQCRPSPPEFT